MVCMIRLVIDQGHFDEATQNACQNYVNHRESTQMYNVEFHLIIQSPVIHGEEDVAAWLVSDNGPGALVVLLLQVGQKW